MKACLLYTAKKAKAGVKEILNLEHPCNSLCDIGAILPGLPLLNTTKNKCGKCLESLGLLYSFFGHPFAKYVLVLDAETQG